MCPAQHLRPVGSCSVDKNLFSSGNFSHTHTLSEKGLEYQHCRQFVMIRRGSLVCKAPGKRRGTVTLSSYASQPWMGFWYICHGIHSLLRSPLFLLFPRLSPESHYITQAGSELIILLTQSPKCWNCKRVPPDSGSCCCLLYIGTYTHTHTMHMHPPPLTYAHSIHIK